MSDKREQAIRDVAAAIKAPSLESVTDWLGGACIPNSLAYAVSQRELVLRLAEALTDLVDACDGNHYRELTQECELLLREIGGEVKG